MVSPTPVGRCTGPLRSTWARIFFAILFLAHGISNPNPTASVTNPGVNNRAPAAANNRPSTISVAGSWPCCKRLGPLVKVRKPCQRRRETPTTAVKTTKKIVDQAPIWPPTSIRRYISTSGVTKKTAVQLRIHHNLGTNPGDVKISADARIWLIVAAIPHGRVATYGQIARLAGLHRAARGVGRVLSNLPGDSTLPWYRVVNARGEISLTGSRAARQKSLLLQEGISFARKRVSLAEFGWQP